MKLVGGDSGRFEREKFVESVLLAPSERVVVDVLFGEARTLTLEHRTPNRTYPLAQIEVGKEPAAPPLAEQLNHIRALYDEVCSHYGLRIGLRHARKHLGWALEIAGQCSRAPIASLKTWRERILTSDDPHRVHQSLRDAFDDFAWSAAA